MDKLGVFHANQTSICLCLIVWRLTTHQPSASYSIKLNMIWMEKSKKL